MAVRRWGSEALVNTNVVGVQQGSSIAALADGGYVVSWTEADVTHGDGSGSSVKFQRYTAGGVKIGGEVIANANPTGYQSNYGIIATDDGGFVMVWTNGDIEYRRFNAIGVAIDAGDRVLTLPNGQFFPQITTISGGFALAFQDNAGIPNQNIRVQRLTANGDLAGGTIDVSITANQELTPAIAESASGGFAVAWDDNTSGRIRFRGFDASGGETFAAVDVSGAASTSVSSPAVLGLANGSYIVTWTSHTAVAPDTSDSVRGRVVSANGTLLGTEFFLNTQTTGDQEFPKLAAMPDGGFVAVYVSDGDIRGQIFDAAGGKLGLEFLVNTSTDAVQFIDSVTVLADGRFVVTWTDNSSNNADDPNINAVRQQIFDPREGIVSGTNGGETVYGNDDLADAISALGGNDTVFGLNGNDSIDGGTGADVMDGGGGDDSYIVDNIGDVAAEGSGSGTDFVSASVSHALGANIENLLLTGSGANGTGNALANTMTGNSRKNILSGALGNDTMLGGGGNDVLIGGRGRDVLKGGGGNDRLDFNVVLETGKTSGTRDIIQDFKHLGDKIDLWTIDANGAAAGNGRFHLILREGAGFDGDRGALRWDQQNLAGTTQDKTLIHGDINGDGRADFSIQLTGLKTLTVVDFVL